MGDLTPIGPPAGTTATMARLRSTVGQFDPVAGWLDVVQAGIDAWETLARARTVETIHPEPGDIVHIVVAEDFDSLEMLESVRAVAHELFPDNQVVIGDGATVRGIYVLPAHLAGLSAAREHDHPTDRKVQPGGS